MSARRVRRTTGPAPPRTDRRARTPHARFRPWPDIRRARDRKIPAAAFWRSRFPASRAADPLTTSPSRKSHSSAPRHARWRGHRPGGDPARKARYRAGHSRARASARDPRSGTPDRRQTPRTGRATDRHWRRAPPPDRAPATSRWHDGCAGPRRPAPRRARYDRRAGLRSSR